MCDGAVRCFTGAAAACPAPNGTATTITAATSLSLFIRAPSFSEDPSSDLIVLALAPSESRGGKVADRQPGVKVLWR
jgi:hypothetical protein